jgi:hypothetical protein
MPSATRLHPSLKQFLVIFAISVPLALIITLASLKTHLFQQTSQLPTPTPYGQPSWLPSPSPTTPTPLNQANTAPIEVDTSTWQTYTSQYGYSIQYPPQWEVKTTEWQEGPTHYGLQPDDEVVIRFSEPNQPPHGGFPFGINVSLKTPQANPNGLTPTQWANKTISSEIPAQIEKINVANTSSARVTTSFDGINNAVFIPHEGKIYRIYGNWFSLQDYQSTFNTILSTFRFLDNENQSSSPVTGSVTIYHRYELAADVKLQAQSTAGQITKMKVWPDTRQEKDEPWQPYKELTTVFSRPNEPDLIGEGNKIFAKFKDNQGNFSPTYSASLFPETGPPPYPD